jgi:Chemotaxis protein CheC, inhibitor of MCP methylation
MLSEIQRDVLSEILNTNIGMAASVLSEMVNQKIILSVPKVDLQKGHEIDLSVFEKDMADFRTSVLSTIRFGQGFSGNAYIVFPADKAKDLVNACVGDLEYVHDEYSKLDAEDFDVIKEISNVILNSLIGEFGNLLNVKLEFSFPDVELTMIDTVENSVLPEDLNFLSMHTSFLLSKSQVRGMIFIALSVSSVNMLLDKINDMLGEIDG